MKRKWRPLINNHEYTMLFIHLRSIAEHPFPDHVDFKKDLWDHLNTVHNLDVYTAWDILKPLVEGHKFGRKLCLKRFDHWVKKHYHLGGYDYFHWLRYKG